MGIKQVSSLDAFLAPKLLKSCKELGIKDLQMHLYVLGLMKDFMKQTEEQIGIADESVIRFLEEMDGDDVYVKLRKYKLVGDHCFFTASFRDGKFHKYFQSLEFCVSMGASAYNELGSIFVGMQKPEAILYNKLGQERNFGTLVDAVKIAIADPEEIDLSIVLVDS